MELEPYLVHLSSLGPAAPEVASLANDLTITETYFFRTREHLRVLEDDVIPRHPSTLRILCAGCSSGEEPYSLAILLRESGRQGRVLALDINPAMLAKAQAARYTRWSLRVTDPATAERWFRKVGTTYVLDEEIRRLVTFEHANLLDERPDLWAPGSQDVIFCRNVLMYFTTAVARVVVARFSQALKVGGHLFLGHAETLRGISEDFASRHDHNTFYYQRVERLPRVDGAPDETESWDEAIRRSSEKIADLARRGGASGGAVPAPAGGGEGRLGTAGGGRLNTASSNTAPSNTASSNTAPSNTARSTTAPSVLPSPGGLPTPPSRGAPPAVGLLERARLLHEAERFGEALAALAEAPLAVRDAPEALLLAAVLHVHVGRFHAAEAACLRLNAADGANPGAWYVLGMTRESLGDRAGASGHYARAARVDGTFAMPHLQLGRLARRAGEVSAARRELGRALTLLPDEEPARLALFGGGFSRDGLVAVCRGELAALGAAP